MVLRVGDEDSYERRARTITQRRRVTGRERIPVRTLGVVGGKDRGGGGRRRAWTITLE